MTADVFDRIYRGNLWNGNESRSGPGSGQAATQRVAEALEVIVRGIGARSVLDVGCGDGWWTPDLPGYTGVDVSAEAISRAKRNHPDRHYEVRAGAELEGLSADLVICRDLIQHVPLEAGQAVLAAIAATGSRWLLASTYTDSENVDVAAGEFYSPDLTAPPFELPIPGVRIFDGWDYEGLGVVRDSRKFLGLWRL